jgi:hypothetical protein
LRNAKLIGTRVLAIAASCFLASACATTGDHGTSPLEGHWQLAGKRFRSVVDLRIDAHEFAGHFGCYAWSNTYSAMSGVLAYDVDVTPNTISGIEMEAPCLRSEYLSQAAGRYWRGLTGLARAATAYHVEGDVLTLTTPNGERLIFRRER